MTLRADSVKLSEASTSLFDKRIGESESLLVHVCPARAPRLTTTLNNKHRQLTFQIKSLIYVIHFLKELMTYIHR